MTPNEGAAVEKGSDYPTVFGTSGGDENQTWRRIRSDVRVRSATAAGSVLITLALGVVLAGQLTDESGSGWQRLQAGLVIFVVLVLVMWLLLVARAATADSEYSARTSYLYRGMLLREQLLIEARAMARYVAKQGLQADPIHLITLSKFDGALAETPVPNLAQLIAAHDHLAKKVSPATPQTLALLSEGKPPVLSWLGNVRLVRMLIGLSAFLLPAFVILAISIGSKIQGLGYLLSNESFGGKLAGAAYLLTAAALGASFAALRTACRYIGNLSYDEKYESSYWIRVVQGITAGLVLSILLSEVFFEGGTNDTGFKITLPLLAFVGGFSEDLVFRILWRIVEAISTLVSGSVDEKLELEKARIVKDAQGRDIAANGDLVATLLRLKLGLPNDDLNAHSQIDKAISDVLGNVTGSHEVEPKLGQPDPPDNPPPPPPDPPDNPPPPHPPEDP